MITDSGAERPRGGAPAPQPVITVGVGMRPGVAAAEVQGLLRRVAAEHGLELGPAVVATLDRRAAEPGLLQAVAPRIPRGFTAEQLGRVPVPTPSDQVATATGTPAVAEAAALLAAGPGAVLLVPKTAGQGVTVAVARSPAR